MTIAVCYLSPEGIVLGADSTASTFGPGGAHFFNFNQKVFELGQDSTLGVLTWGLASLGSLSYRTLLARVSDRLAANPPGSVEDAANALIDVFWPEYQAFGPVQRVQTLHAKAPNGTAEAGAAVRTAEEESEYEGLKSSFVVGFCVAGYALPNRIPGAVSVMFDPTGARPVGQAMTGETSQWWGVPNIIQRLIFGADGNLKSALLSSGKWNGTPQELDQIVQTQSLSHASLPIRDAVDYVYSCIHCTIKAMKFSSFSQVCGGPIEIAVITTDRKFRWVRHKPWDAAIIDGDSND
ncbi:hypothetical protein [Paraburkholderia sp. BL21I4N1]|uniref:hypothetical protein n=1 Tax=Paraburkholderia sp. BL21I4N1 TaxID=1938801 RepID=UPI000CFB9E66|nr:hypothetical protein [Paraburkholderia sp. BL21I4N1]